MNDVSYEQDFEDLIQSGKLNNIFGEDGYFNGYPERLEKESIRSVVYGICSLYMQNNNPKIPFRYLYGEKTRRSFDISDLKKEEALFLYDKLDEIENIFVKTKIADVLQHSKLLPSKDKYNAAKIAIKGYYEIIDNLLIKKHSYRPMQLPQAALYIERVCNLVNSMKGAKEEKKELRGKILKYADVDCERSESARLLYYSTCFKAISRLDFPDDSVYQKYYEKTLAMIKDLEESDIKSLWVRSFYELAKKFTKDKLKQDKLTIDEAKTYEMSAKDEPDFRKRERLKKALPLYQKMEMNEEKERITLEIERLGNCFPSQNFEIKLDVPPEIINEATARVSGKSFKEAIFKLCSFFYLPSKANIRDEVKKQQLHISSLSQKSIFNKDGRITASFSPGEEMENFYAIRLLRYSYYSVIKVQVIPALERINNEHTFSWTDIMELVRYSPFVPGGYETIFAKGIYYFLIEEFLEASHLLVPQVEKCLRNLLFSRRVTSVIKDKREESKTNIKGLLDKCLEGKIIGEDLGWLLETYLISDAVNIRHNIAHGNMGDEGERNLDVIALCYIIFFLTFFHEAQEYFDKQNMEK
ncbi:MAG: hypothetical protein LBM19_01505 [Holosporales bacterium]|jgi:hypothetical protein|nr:hypothetical protein [Holosporales bacterium]